MCTYVYIKGYMCVRTYIYIPYRDICIAFNFLSANTPQKPKPSTPEP